MNKAMKPSGSPGRVCAKCAGAKTVNVSIKGQLVQKPCPACNGSGQGGYVTK